MRRIVDCVAARLDGCGYNCAVSKSERQIEVIARGVLIRGNRVLLCQNRKHGYYYLPGGHVEFGESAAAALAREFEEETGLVIRCGTCVLVTEGVFRAGSREHHELNLAFHVQHLDVEADERGDASPSPIPSREADIAFEWVELAAVVDVDLRPASVKAWLAAGGESDPLAERCTWISEIRD